MATETLYFKNNLGWKVAPSVWSQFGKAVLAPSSEGLGRYRGLKMTPDLDPESFHGQEVTILRACISRELQESSGGWWTGMTLRDGMGRDMGGEFRMGDTCTPMADSC